MSSLQRPTRPRLRDRYDRRQQQLVRDAARVFAQSGYDQTTLQDLADAIDLATGGIYHYVGSKDRLLGLICDQLMDPLLAQANELIDQTEPGVGRLRELVRLWVTHVAEHRDHMRVFQQERHVIEQGQQWRRVRGQRKQFERIVERVIMEVHERGQLRLADDRITLTALLGMVNHMVQWYRPRGRLTPLQIADGYVDLIVSQPDSDSNLE